MPHLEFIVEGVLVAIFLNASGFIDWLFPWRHPPLEWPMLEKDWCVKTGQQIMKYQAPRRGDVESWPGKRNGAVTLYLLGWIEAHQMEDMLTARFAIPDKVVDPNMVGIYLSYELVNQGHKYLVDPDV